ncbi:response regulator [uncultured Desulfobacter sp.]|uniref:response regulator n=1 Tax=uncultured Desulfobacter sp. TaxID=240139 RepID=UPI002AAC3779|nr:response regulator [uncultured Desulfobacter sp.]
MRSMFKFIFFIWFLLLYSAPNLCHAHDGKAADFLKTLTREEQQWLKAHPVIRLGTGSDRPPFEFVDDQGKYQGIVADYLELIVSRLPVTFRRVEKEDGSQLSWTQILNAAQNKQLDCVACLVKTGERTRYLDFTRPYLDFPYVVVVDRNNDTYRKLSDFNGQKFAVVDSHPVSKQLRMQHPELIYVPVENPLQGLRAVALGKVAGYVVNAGDASYHIKKHSLNQLKIAVTLEDIDTQLHMGVRKDWPLLAVILDKALNSLTARETMAIHNRWISLDYEKKIAWHHVLSVAAPPVFIFLVIIALVLMVNRRLKKEVVKRQQTEKLLLKSEERLHFALDAANAYYWQIDMQSREITYTSLQLFVCAGYSEQDAPQTLDAYFSLIHPDDKALIDEEFQKVFSGKTTLKNDYRLRRKQSGWIWIHSAGQVVEWDTRGKASKIAGLTMDITERHSLLKKITQSQEQLRIISEYTHDWQSWRDLDGKLLWVNQAVERVTGYTVAECMKMHDYPFPIYDERDGDVYRNITNAVLKEKKRQEAQLRVRRKDGRQVWVSSAYEPVLDQNGRIIGLAGAAKDITKQIKAEQGLRLLSKVFKDSSDPIVITDLSGNITDLNEAVIEAYGYSREELLGKYIGIFAEKDAETTHSTLYRRCIKGEVLKNIEGNRVRKDGTVLPHLFTYSLLKDDKGKHLGIASIAKDITWIKEAEKELKDYRSHLEDLVKERTRDLEEARQVAEDATRAKSDFLANMSHEIRTPLNAIIGFAHLALQTELDSRQHDYIHKIQNGSKALLGVINDILDFSKIEAGKLTMESIEFFLEEVLETVTNLVGIKAQENGLEVIYNIDPNIPRTLIGDPIRLGQILLNLTNNAVKFTKEGQIVLGCALVEEEADEAMLEFYVQDTGIGLTKAHQDKLFQAFSQADATTTRKYGGTGLGLFISKSLVEMMNGHIRVESEYGQGTTFFFTVRLKRVGLQTITSRFAASDTPKKKILVVDDNSISRTVLEKMLTAMSFKVIQADSAEAGLDELEAAGKQGEPFDLVLMDWQMPGMDGLQASETIKNTLGTLPPSVLMVSAHAREELIQKANRLGLDGCLIKPVSPSLLSDSIMTALGEKVQPRTNPCPNERLACVTKIQGVKLLVAEDNEVNQQVAKGILENYGFIVDLADNGILALEAVQKTKYDAVLMDINMPEMDGYAASREIRQLSGYQDLPIIAMTANAMSGDREKALAAGMNDHVAKPIDVKNLFNTLSTWIKTSGPESGQNMEIQPGTKINNALSSETLGPLPGINIKAGLNRMSQDSSLYLNLLKKFAESQADTANKIQQALVKKDIETAQRLAHTIKGVSGNISATLVFESAKRIDNALKNIDIEAVLSLLPDFSARLSEVVQGINSLETEKQTGKTQQNGPVPDLDALKPILLALQRMLDENDTHAVSIAGQLRDQIPGGSMEGGLMDQLGWEIGEYDFNKARITLQHLFQKMGLD